MQIQHYHLSSAEYPGSVFEDGKLLLPASLSARVVPSCQIAWRFYIDAYAAAIRYWS